MSSFLLFNKLSPLFKMMWSFSVRHKWQSLVPPLYGCACWIIFHDTLYGSCLSFNSHIFLESSVWFRSFSSLKELVCALKRVLKVFSVSPIYLCSFFSCSTATVASYYITAAFKHCPFSGHISGFLQLHIFAFIVGSSWAWCLVLAKTDPTLGRQLYDNLIVFLLNSLWNLFPLDLVIVRYSDNDDCVCMKL